MSALVFGAGNSLLSDEGFGVHCVRYLMEHYRFTDDVEVCDGGTLGIMASHLFEDAQDIILVDVVAVDGEPGTIIRYDLDDIRLNRLPTKLSPHQIGVQEMLTLAELRDRLPRNVVLYGIIPESYDAGVELSAKLAAQLPKVADAIVADLRQQGYTVTA